MKFKEFWVQFKLDGEAHDRKVPEKTFVIGRAPECDLTIQSDVISRNHLRVSLEGEVIYIEDLGSTNGTYIDRQKLAPNKKYRYDAGKPFHIDADDLVSIKITPLYERSQHEIEMQSQALELERQKASIAKKNNRIKREIAKENYIRAAGESVDNIFENLKFVAKSARFNKEKAIAEARAEMERLIDDSQDEANRIIEEAEAEAFEAREKLAAEIKALEKRTKEEAKGLIQVAKEKAQKSLSKSKEKAKKLESDALAIREKAQAEADEIHKDVIARAQDKHGQIIAEAHLKNQQLQEENKKLVIKVTDLNSEATQLESKTANLNQEFEQAKLDVERAKAESRAETSNLNALKVQVLNMENRAQEAKDVLERKVPELEGQINELNKTIKKSKSNITNQEDELEKLKAEIFSKKNEISIHEEKAKKAEARIDELNDKIMDAEDNLFKLNKIRQQRNEDIDKEIAERRERQSKDEERAKQAIARKKKKTDTEIEVNLEKAKERAQQLVQEAKAEAAEILQEARDEKTNVDAMLEARRKQVEEEVMQKLADVRKETKELQEKTQKEVELTKKNLKAEVEVEKDRMLSTATTDANEIIEKAKKEAKAIVEEARSKADQDIQDLQKEIDDRKKETDQEIQEIRTHAVNQLDEQRRQFEKDEAQRTHVRVMKLKKELNDVLRARISPFLKSSDHLEKVSTIIGKSVNAIMLDEIDDDFIANENYSDIDPSLQQEKNKKFFMAAGAGVVVLIIFFVLLPTFKEAAVEQSRQIANEMKKADEEQIARTKAQNDLRKEFNPEKVDEFKSSYTDRVLYTQDYVKIELNQEYREEWILDLQDFFVDELRLSENALVPFISQEANLIMELDQEMKKINGNFEDQGITRMRDIEKGFEKKLRAIIKKDSHYKKVMNFKKEFFNKNKSKYK